MRMDSLEYAPIAIAVEVLAGRRHEAQCDPRREPGQPLRDCGIWRVHRDEALSSLDVPSISADDWPVIVTTTPRRPGITCGKCLQPINGPGENNKPTTISGLTDLLCKHLAHHCEHLTDALSVRRFTG